jgi:hypothetical protein
MRLKSLQKSGTDKLGPYALSILLHPKPEHDIVLNSKMYFTQARQYEAWTAFRNALMGGDVNAKPHLVTDEETTTAAKIAA